MRKVKETVSQVPRLMAEWDIEKNKEEGIDPEKLTSRSGAYAYWKGNCGHTWKAKISNRYNGRGCPCCSNRVVVKGINDLATTHPEIAKEWYQPDNGPLTPYDVTHGMGKKVSWQCPRGHIYKATILHRTNGAGTRCPVCNSGRQTSFAEQALYYYVKEIFPNAINSYKDIFTKGMELDIYIPELKLGIEYDGVYWHNKRQRAYEREERKYSICKDNGIKLYRIREKQDNDNFYPAADMSFYMDKKLSETQALNLIIRRVLTQIDPAAWVNPYHYMYGTRVDVDRDRLEILAYLKGVVKKSVAVFAPELLEEWDYEKNGNLKPDMIAAGSSTYVNWVCKKCSYKWKASIYSRAKNHTGCPKCAGMVFEKGVNDLATKYPELLQDWDYEKNTVKGFHPKEIPYNLMKKVHWICHKCGHKWLANVNSRTVTGNGCIKCGYKAGSALKHKRRLEERGGIADPFLLKEWDYKKNSELGIYPENTIPQSTKRVFWICSICGYEWQISVGRRTKGVGCRKCADKVMPALIKKALIAKGHGLTDPLLIKEWDYEKNESKPENYTYGSGKKVYWNCSKCGHSWQAVISSRCKGSGCPACAGNILVQGKNDLASVRPDLAEEWDYDKNGELTPKQVSYSSGQKVWWLCKKGHDSYLANLSHRVRGTGCPICGKRKISEKFSKPIDQFSKDGLFIKTYASAKLAAEACGVSSCAICNAIRGKAKTSGGYIWKEHKE